MYVIKRTLRLDANGPEIVHYYTKNETTEDIKEAKRFLTKWGAISWLKSNYDRVEYIFGGFRYFNLIKIKKETLNNDKR